MANGLNKTTPSIIIANIANFAPDVWNSLFSESIESKAEFIAKDSFSRALKLLTVIDKRIDSILNMPYKYRQSHYHDADNVRDLIVKGYTIPYLVDEQRQVVVILDIFKWSQR